MKKLLFYIIFFYSLVATSQNTSVKVEVDTTNIRIGEQFQYKISINETKNVIIPKLQLKGIEVVDSLKLDTIKNKLIQKYILTSFDSGSHYIPQQQIFIQNQAHLTDSLLINVATIAVDTTKIKKFPIKGIKGEPYRFADYKHIVFWVLGILILVSTVLYFALKRTRDDEAKTSEQLLTPYQEALRGFKLLDNKLLWQNNKIKQYYSELTDIVRNYIERELHIPALETTTEGLIETLGDFKDTESILTEKETIQSLEKLLKQADLVKFAKSKPLAYQIEGDRNIAKNIIDDLKPNIIEESNENTTDTLIIVEKPTIKKPSLVVKIITILMIIVLAGLISYSIVEAIPLLKNTLNNSVTNVQ